MAQIKMKSYEELMTFDSFDDRLKYLSIDDQLPCVDTFGKDRYLNQSFYRSKEWRDIRSRIISRDYGCDLAVPGFNIYGKIIIHHINPIRLEDINDFRLSLLDPNNLICVSMDTHNRIHYNNNTQFIEFKERTSYDTCPWKDTTI